MNKSKIIVLIVVAIVLIITLFAIQEEQSSNYEEVMELLDNPPHENYEVEEKSWGKYSETNIKFRVKNDGILYFEYSSSYGTLSGSGHSRYIYNASDNTKLCESESRTYKQDKTATYTKEECDGEISSRVKNMQTPSGIIEEVKEKINDSGKEYSMDNVFFIKFKMSDGRTCYTRFIAEGYPQVSMDLCFDKDKHLVNYVNLYGYPFAGKKWNIKGYDFNEEFAGLQKKAIEDFKKNTPPEKIC